MITILMCTFNGEKYLKQQLDSLLKQTYQDFIIRVCDDCSTDGTYSILQDYVQKHPHKIFIEQNEKNSGKASINFLQMMKNHKNSDYFMCADQDDVWLPQKIESTYAAMLNLEQKEGKDKPLLVHTDLTVVDENLTILSMSMMQMQGLAKCGLPLNNLLAQNNVTGCTMMINQALIKKIVIYPSKIIMHDWWCALIAAAFGKIGFLPNATILYRQHAENAVGAKNIYSARYILHWFLNGTQIKTVLQQTYEQAAAFETTFNDMLNDEQLRLLQDYQSIQNKMKIARILTIVKTKAWKCGWQRKLAQLIYI